MIAAARPTLATSGDCGLSMAWGRTPGRTGAHRPDQTLKRNDHAGFRWSLVIND